MQRTKVTMHPRLYIFDVKKKMEEGGTQCTWSHPSLRATNGAKKMRKGLGASKKSNGPILLTSYQCTWSHPRMHLRLYTHVTSSASFFAPQVHFKDSMRCKQMSAAVRSEEDVKKNGAKRDEPFGDVEREWPSVSKEWSSLWRLYALSPEVYAS